MTDLIFLAGFSFLLAHEMDAVHRREWHMLPGLSRITDETRAFQWFTAAHVPLYVVLLWAITASDEAGLNERATLWLNGFFVAHAVLHVVLYHPPHNGCGSHSVMTG
ncbi:MAG: hypothetical protein H0V12_00155 [Chloroflexi bacterium]|nr:hypothetical protein [Chloroflexota bacterium]